MKFKISLVLVGALLFGSSAVASAGRSLPAAEQTQEYVAPNGVRTVHWDEQMEQLPPGPAMTFHPRAGDRSVRFRVDDLYGRNVLVYVFQEDASGEQVRHEFCATSGTVPLVSQKALTAYVYAGICTNHNAGFATSGTMTARFSRDGAASGGNAGHY